MHQCKNMMSYFLPKSLPNQQTKNTVAMLTFTRCPIHFKNSGLSLHSGLVLYHWKLLPGTVAKVVCTVCVPTSQVCKPSDGEGNLSEAWWQTFHRSIFVCDAPVQRLITQNNLSFLFFCYYSVTWDIIVLNSKKRVQIKSFKMIDLYNVSFSLVVSTLWPLVVWT